jgi:hypothetical protein
MKKAAALLLGTGLSLVSGAALAQQQWGGTYQPAMPPARSSSIDNLGEEMQFVFGVDRVMGVSWDSQTVEPEGGPETVNKATTVALFGTGGQGTNVPRLALDYFVIEGLSLGGSFVYIHRSTEIETDGDAVDGPSSSTVLLHPRVGYAYAFDETFSIWPRLGITWFQSSSESTDPISGDTSTTTLSGLDLTGEVMLGISPIENFAFLVGPYLDLGLSGTQEFEPASGPSSEADSTLTGFGLAVSVVGYY